MTPNDLLKHFTSQQNQLKKDIREMIIDSNVNIYAKIIDEVPTVAELVGLNKALKDNIEPEYDEDLEALADEIEANE